MMFAQSSRATGAILISAALWGLWWIPLRGSETYGLEGIASNTWLYLAGSVGLLPFAWRRRAHIRSGGRQLAFAALLFGGAITLWNLSLLWGPVVRVTLLFYLAPVWGTLLGAVFLKIPVGPLRLATILMGLSGAAILLGLKADMFTHIDISDLTALAAGILFAGGATMTHAGDGVDGIDQTIIAFPIAGLISYVAYMFAGHQPPPDFIAALGWASAASMLWLVPGTMLLLWGARYVEPGRVTILLLAEVATATVSAVLLTEEAFGLREAIGFALIMAAGLAEGMAELRKKPKT